MSASSRPDDDAEAWPCDVLVVGGDPLADLGALRDVRLVMQNGAVRHRAAPDR